MWVVTEAGHQGDPVRKAQIALVLSALFGLYGALGCNSAPFVQFDGGGGKFDSRSFADASCTDPKRCCPPSALSCVGDPDRGTICTCNLWWDCDAQREDCSQARQVPGSGDWDCRWTEYQYLCERDGDADKPPHGGGGWQCSYNAEQRRWICKKDPPDPDNVPGGGDWNCRVSESKLRCSKKPPVTPIGPDPCRGKTNAPRANYRKKILFYAPANYKYGVNKYATGIRDVLEQSYGYQVTLVTSVTDGVDFDGCNLTRRYRQLWLFLPCNNLQRMDDKSFAALKSFYQFGGGVALLTDNHYFTDNNPNTHCSTSATTSDPGFAWEGSANTPSDAVRIGQMLGVRYTIGYSAGKVNYAQKHPLVEVFERLAPRSIAQQTPFDMPWRHIQIEISQNPDAKYLPLLEPRAYTDPKVGPNANGRWAAYIDAVKANPLDPQFSVRRLAVMISPLYCYHCESPPTIDRWRTGTDRGFYAGIAGFFEANARADDMIASRSLPQDGVVVPFKGQAARTAQHQTRDRLAFRKFIARWPAAYARYETTAVQRLALGDYDKHRIARALGTLALRGKISVGELVKYFEHPSFFVRHHALLALTDLPQARSSIANALKPQLASATGHKRLYLVRSLIALGDLSAVLANLRSEKDSKIRQESAVALAEHDIQAVTALLRPQERRLRAVVIDRLGKAK